MEATTDPAMNMSPSAKDRLRKSHFQIRIRPILSPFVKEFELSIPQKPGLGNVDRLGIVIWVENVIGPRTLFRNDSRGSGFEFTVFDDRKADPSPIQFGVVGSDSPIIS